MFDRWCTSQNVDSDFERLRQIILIEEFKNCLHPDIRIYLDEQKVQNLEQAATAADDYALTHVSFVKPNNQQKITTSDSSRGGADTSQVSSSKLGNSSEMRGNSVKNTHNLIKSECWAQQRKRSGNTVSNQDLVH
jgi:hypothetical protein